MKKKHSLKIFLYAVLGGTILASGCAISAFSFAWFSNNNNITRGFDGSTTGAYFARGNGSEGNPYVINKPIHLYNLAWLQYVGFFKDKEPYFIIERDLDMSGWTLPPIGTTMNPFLGHLDGYGRKVAQERAAADLLGKQPQQRYQTSLSVTALRNIMADIHHLKNYPHLRLRK